ncbi:MAG: tol-pal system-associated acyl-CoA thioesterase [Burkholderiales bacterium]
MSAAPFNWNVRVYYEDTDIAGVVYYANYLRYFERARTEWLRHLGIGQEKLLKDEGVKFVVRRATLDFVSAARLDDLLQISVKLLKFAGASLHLEQEASSDGRRLCAATVQVACVRDADFHPIPIPEFIKVKMQS